MQNHIINWRKSSYSGNNGGVCVEVGTWRKSDHSARQGDGVEPASSAHLIAVRDSKNPEGTKLAFSQRAWSTFARKIQTSASPTATKPKPQCP